MLLPSLAAVFVLGMTSPAAVQAEAYDPRVVAYARQLAAGESDEAITGLSALAASGNLDANNLLGEIYAGAMGVVSRDRPKSCEFFRAAREAGGSAAHNYAQCLWEGAYGERQMQEARVWYQRGADDGFLQSKCALGNMIAKGEGGAADPARGMALCREAADAGEPNAQTDLGDYYGGGTFVPQDYVEARRWYGLAAAQGQRNALFNLGIFDWNGFTGPPDFETAGKWFEAAYAAGRPDAALLVGRAALMRAVPDTSAGPVDAVWLERAKTWFEVAAEKDPSEASRAQAAVALAQISGYEALSRSK